MKKMLLVFVCLALLPLAETSAKENIGNTKTTAKADLLMQQFFQGTRSPGLAVSVGIAGKIIWSKGYGYADLEQRVPMTASLTKLRIGSVIKSMTAFGVEQLVDAGKLDLDVPIQTYVPDFPEKQATISTRQLLGHLAGIRHYQGDEFYNHHHYESVTDGLAIFANDPLLSAPGEEFHYSSYGFNLVSAAIETASGQDYISYMQEHVFKPLGMVSTTADDLRPIIPARGRYYELTDDQIYNEPEVDNSYKWASGGFISTSDDLVRFGLAQLSDSLVSGQTRQVFWTEQHNQAGKGTGYGLGWSLTLDSKGRQWIGHGGGSVGGSTQFWIMPETGLVVAMISNLSDFDYGDVLIRLGDVFLSSMPQ